MRVRTTLTVTGTALALLGAAACGGAPVPAAETVAWVDRVCGALRSVQEAGSTQPAIASDDPADALTGFSTYLGGVVAAVDGAVTSLDTAGPSPVPRADADVERLQGELGEVRTAFAAARDRLAQVDPADPAALATGMVEALAPVQALDVTSDAIGDLRRNPDFDAAAAAVPSCAP